MKILAWSCAAAAAFMVSACGPTSEPPVEAQNETAANGCPAMAEAPWRPLSGAEFHISAGAAGPSCAEANATITIADASGAVLYSETYPAAQVMVLAGAATPEAMQTALAEWLGQSARFDATGDLPAWAEGAEAPSAGEFPFYPEEGANRAAYAALRERNAPMFCYVQGMESSACLALENGALTKIGVQTFPG